MIDFAAARSLVEAHLNKIYPATFADELVILDKSTLERGFGWVFFYSTKRFAETHDFHHTLIGNAPIIVDREDGSLHFTGTARPAEEYIRDFEAKRHQKL